MIMKLDMHFHSTNSDGYCSWEQLIQKAQEQKLDFIALTDHDRVSDNFAQEAQKAGLQTCEAVEISACNYDEDKSLHITFYAKQISQEVKRRLDEIIVARIKLIEGQIQVLQKYGFQIDVSAFYDFYAKLGRKKESLNKFDIVYYMFQDERNKRLAQDLHKQEISFVDFYMIYLKKWWAKYEKFAYKIADYEPDIELLWEWNATHNGVLAIAHPNFTFKKDWPQKFADILPRYLAKWINALEINTLATQEWVEKILELKEKYNLYVTFGSDFHKEDMDDGKHGKFGEQNPYISDTQRAAFFQEYKQKIALL